jgi:hypothetical protein
MSPQQIERHADGRLCLTLLEWHGGMPSALYSFGSRWLSALRNGRPAPTDDGALAAAIRELESADDPDATATARRLRRRFAQALRP